MSPIPKNFSDGVCNLQTFEKLTMVSSNSALTEENSLRKRHPASTQVENQVESSETPQKRKLEVLYDGYYYDVTEFIKRHPGGNIIELYTDAREDATIPIQQFHYRSLKTVMAKMKGLPKRPASEEESKCFVCKSSSECSTRRVFSADQMYGVKWDSIPFTRKHYERRRTDMKA